MKRMTHPLPNKTIVVLTDGSSYKKTSISTNSKFNFLDQDNRSHPFWSYTKENNNIEVGGRRAKYQKKFNVTS